MCARGNQAESSCLEAGGESLNVVDSELDLHFAIGGHAASIKKEEASRRGAVVRKTRPGYPEVTFFTFFQEKEIFFIKAFTISSLQSNFPRAAKQQLSGQRHLTLGAELR